MPPKEPRPPSRFRLDLGGKEGIGNFRECTGLDSETTVIEHTSVDANGNPIIRKVPGALKWSNITLKRGVDESQELSFGVEATDPDELLRLHARLGAELLERVAPILTVLTEAAATDADAAALAAFQEEGRFFGMGATVGRLVELGALRDGITPSRAQESLWMLSGLEPFQLAMRRGWSVDEYADWYLACARGLLLAG